MVIILALKAPLSNNKSSVYNLRHSIYRHDYPMFPPSEQPYQFVTLVAYNNSSALQLQNVQNYDDLAFIFTTSHQEAATIITEQRLDLIIAEPHAIKPEIISLSKTSSCINSSAPIIALVGEIDSDLRKKLIAAGFDDCIAKPLTEENLMGTIKLWRHNDSLMPIFASIRTLLAKSRNNTKLALTLYKKLFEEFPLQIKTLQEALKFGQYQQAITIIHTLNGSARTCYLQDIQELANNLEISLIHKQYNFADGYFLMLHQSISDFLNLRSPILSYLTNTQ